jgi:hypothetical protein
MGARTEWEITAMRERAHRIMQIPVDHDDPRAEAARLHAQGVEAALLWVLGSISNREVLLLAPRGQLLAPSRFDGGIEANTDTVVRYLQDNYTERGATIERRRAVELCQGDAARQFLATGEALRSHAYFVGNEIADDAGLDFIPYDDDPDD